MSQPPPLQTVATLTGGSSPVMQQAFFWGIPGQPFSVGTHGDWVVNAPGVEPLHFFLNFDGRMILVAGGPSAAPVTVAGVPVDHTWRPVPVFAEIAFGGARMRVTCEEAPQQAGAEPTVSLPAVPPTNPTPFEGVPVHTSHAPDRIAYERPSPLRTQPLGPAAQQQAPFTAAGASGSQPPPGVVPTLHSMAAPENHGRPPSAAPPAVIALPGSGFAPVPATPTAGIPRSSFPPPPAAPAAGFQAQPQHDDVGAVSTVSDAGALRALANRVQAEPGASTASAEAYFAEVQRAAVGQVPAAGSPAPRQAQQPSTAPAAFGAGGTRIILGAPPKDATLEEDPGARAQPEKQKTSWVMRVVLMLLPIAGYFAIFWEPPAEAPPPVEEPSASTEPTSSSTGSAAAPASASARVAEVAASAAVPSAAPSASSAAPASSEASPRPTSSTPVVAPELSAAPVGVALPASRQARDALNAAFEGNLEDAAQRYEKLATGPNGETYRVSARLIRERALRKP